MYLENVIIFEKKSSKRTLAYYSIIAFDHRRETFDHNGHFFPTDFSYKLPS